jgi:hypothetical protein
MKVALLERLIEVQYATSAVCAVFGWDEEEAFNRVFLSKLTNVDANGRFEVKPDGRVKRTPLYEPPVLDDLV